MTKLPIENRPLSACYVTLGRSLEPAKIFQSVAQQAWGVGWVGMVGVWRGGERERGEKEIYCSERYKIKIL